MDKEIIKAYYDDCWRWLPEWIRFWVAVAIYKIYKVQERVNGG